MTQDQANSYSYKDGYKLGYNNTVLTGGKINWKKVDRCWFVISGKFFSNQRDEAKDFWLDGIYDGMHDRQDAINASGH